jgi:N4-gp56 family major capsid protein
MWCPKGDGTAVASRSALDATSKLNVKTIKKAVAFLKKNNAPKIDGSYVAIVHPYAAHDLMSDPEWIDAHKYAQPENLFEGEIGKIAGTRFIESSEAKVFEGGVYGTLIMGANAYGVTEITGGGLQTIIKQKGSAGTADPLDQRSSIGWKATKTAEVLVPMYMIRIESKSDFDIEAN